MNRRFLQLWFNFYFSTLLVGIFIAMCISKFWGPSTDDPPPPLRETNYGPLIFGLVVDAPVSLGLCYFFFYRRTWEIKKKKA